MSRAFVRLTTAILDDPVLGQMSDHDWVECVKGIIRTSEVHYDRNDDPDGRIEWSSIRKLVSPKIFARDGKVCKKCGSTENLEIDHIIPIFHGGTNDPDNLQVLCRHCNRTKWAKLEN